MKKEEKRKLFLFFLHYVHRQFINIKNVTIALVAKKKVV